MNSWNSDVTCRMLKLLKKTELLFYFVHWMNRLARLGSYNRDMNSFYPFILT